MVSLKIFDNGTLPINDDYYRAKDVEEMNGHFLMFNYMLDSIDENLAEKMIKQMAKITGKKFWIQVIMR